jgi:hypothetical protein
MRFSVLIPLTTLLAAASALPNMQVEIDPTNPDGDALATIETRSESAAGGPLAARGEAEDLDKRACPSSKKISYQGGGCSTAWAGHCYDRCVSRSSGKGCCSGTVSSSIVGSGCVWGWSTCECSCMKG